MFLQPSWRHLPDAGEESMIIFRGSDLMFDTEEPKSSFWMQGANSGNHSYAKTCESVVETANATGKTSLETFLF